MTLLVDTPHIVLLPSNEISLWFYNIFILMETPSVREKFPDASKSGYYNQTVMSVEEVNNINQAKKILTQ
jgi:hypothetical protein